MDYKVIISEAAEYDIEQAFEWYELQNPVSEIRIKQTF